MTGKLGKTSTVADAANVSPGFGPRVCQAVETVVDGRQVFL